MRLRHAARAGVVIVAAMSSGCGSATDASGPASIVVASTASLSGVQYDDSSRTATLPVSNSSGGRLSLALGSIQYSSNASSGWLTAKLSSSATPATLTLEAVLHPSYCVPELCPTFMAPGIYTATITLTSPTAQVTNSPQTISVTLTISPLPAASAVPLVAGDDVVTVRDTTHPPGNAVITITNTGTTTALLVRADSVVYAAGTPANWLLCVPNMSPAIQSFASKLLYCEILPSFITATGTYTATVWVSGLNTKPASGRITLNVQAVQTPVASIDFRLGASQLRVGDTTSCTIRLLDAQGNTLDRAFQTMHSGDGDVIESCRSNSRVIGATPGNSLITATYGAMADSASLTIVPAGPALIATAASTAETTGCAVTPGADLYCWGRSLDGTGTAILAPRLIASGVSVSSISVGGPHACALSATGRAACWGENSRGELGTGDRSVAPTPVNVQTDLTFSRIAAGRQHSCALTSSGDVYCWGAWSGNSATTSDTSDALVPVRLPGGIVFTTIAAGAGHSCGLTSAGAAYCWGSNGAGQLGDGTTINRTAPVAVSGNLTFRLIATGAALTCGVTTDGRTYCWGFIPFAPSVVPVLVAGPALTSISVGNAYACGLTADGSASCWWIPGQPNAGALKFVSLSAGQEHACGIAVGGAVYCWGYPVDGQLGDRVGSVNRLAPFPIAVP